MSQKNSDLPGKRKYTMAKADSSEMAILPSAMPIAITRLLRSIVATGTLTPENSAAL